METLLQPVKAVFMRGGTSKGLVLHARDLPDCQARRDALFLALMGSPDPHGRQLNGMGGGISSLSKICVVGPSSRPDADVDYTFAQVMINEARVDYSGNCGNMSSAIGPFAVDEGLVSVSNGDALVRIHNVNTRKVIHARFPVLDGRAQVAGDLAIPGVAGRGAPVQLNFLDPGGATTGALLPAGKAARFLEIPGLGRLEVSMVDAANACVFVRASDIGLTGVESPAVLNGCPEILTLLEEIRIRASVAMGIAADFEQARAKRVVPFVGFVSPPRAFMTLAGETVPADDVDLTVRMLSSGQPHMAVQLTVSLCLAAAAAIEGSVVHAVTRSPERRPVHSGAVRIGMPSGVLSAGADVVRHKPAGWHVERGYFYRTARRLFAGQAYPQPMMDQS